MTALTLFLILGSVYRITMLICEDTITAPARDALLRWLDQPKHAPVDEVKTVDRVWLVMRCRCGHRVWRDGDRIMVSDHGEASHMVANNDAPMAVLAYFNDHRNKHSRERRFTVLPVWLSCPWCMSVYVAPIVVASGITYGTYGWWLLAAGTLTASAVTGIIATFAKP